MGRACEWVGRNEVVKYLMGSDGNLMGKDGEKDIRIEKNLGRNGKG